MIFNIAIVALILLATYWYAFKEGFFSGLIHLACVLVAGALAFAFWEPLAMTMIGTGVGEFAWGMSILGLFGFSLIFLRIATNLLIPHRQNFPNMVDILGGGATGLCSGVITAGIGMIGIGFLPIGNTFADGKLGWTRKSGQPAMQSYVIPVHHWTESFYANLSAGSFKPMVNRGNLKTDYPGVAEQAWSLHRDTAVKGRVKLTIAPEDVQIGDPQFGPLGYGIGGEYYVVPLTFNKTAFHKGDVMILSAAQARLIAKQPLAGQAREVFPSHWLQNNKYYTFEDNSYFITNTSGEQKVDAWLAFPAGQVNTDGELALMLKGTRFPLPTVEESRNMITMSGSSGGTSLDPSMKELGDAPSWIKANNRMPVEFNSNRTPAGLTLNADNQILGGLGDIAIDTRSSISQKLRVSEIFQRDGTRLVKVNVSRANQNNPIDIWGDENDARTKEGDKARIVLVDSGGQTFEPIGYLWRKDRDRLLNVNIDRENGIRSVGQILEGDTPASTGKDTIELLFLIPEGRNLKGIMLGNSTIARFNVFVPK